MSAAPAVRIDSVDATGLTFTTAEDVVLDVDFDGRRIWSFWTLRDSVEQGPQRTIAWPRRLERFLDGRTTIQVRAHVATTVLYEAEHRFGTSEERIAVLDDEGRPLGIDNSGRLQRTFDTRTAEQTAPLIDAIGRILDELTAAGLEAFPAYGTLLGAVREGRLLGHDSDADLGYVSRHTTPVDVIRENFTVTRRLVQLGYRVERYSGGGFKVFVPEADGSIRGLDVFAGFFSDGHLVLMGEVRAPFREEWIRPLGTTTLEGRTFPAPADPDKLLTATYGPTWRTPDPAFSFTTPASTRERLNDWFRGTNQHRPDWDRRYVGQRRYEPSPRGTRLVRDLLREEGTDIEVVDLGCGRGESAWWLAGRGVPALGLDYSVNGFRAVAEAADPDLPLSFDVVNLLETRSVLGWGARLARRPVRQVVMANHLIDALPPRGRQNAYRLARMAAGPGGRFHLRFLSAAVDDDPLLARKLISPIDPETVAAEVERRHGRIVSCVESDANGTDSDDRDDRDERDDRDDNDDAGHRAGRRTCRMVVEWTR
ncbi:methyltransferase domain-containing protein [Nocardioides pantholopis]|uniref:class I SAM-dependent methyltransferase n=1 Tax=Nocardioides pantholopis TaxID=2483798 RepID=UPI000F08BCDB|nr:class I SAM-dependent methyltransferase [Nocardioides pantholopis]